MKKIRDLQPIFVLSAIFLITFIFDVPTVTKIPLCFLKAISGIDCPGCGLLRSMISISHGNFREAIHFHLLGPFVYFFLFICLVKDFLELFWGRLEISFTIPGKKIILTSILIVLGGQWSVRVVGHILTNY